MSLPTMGSHILPFLRGRPRKSRWYTSLLPAVPTWYDATGQLALECALLLCTSHGGDLAPASQERFRHGAPCSLRVRLQPRAPEVE
eukprot:3104073-Pyramimonas_sp.AAC.1